MKQKTKASRITLVFLAFLLLFQMAACGRKAEDGGEEEAQEEVSLPTDTAMLLEEAYENGELDSDRYAALYLTAVTDPEELEKDYCGEESTAEMKKLVQFCADHWEELEADTQKDIADAVLMTDLDFGPPEGKEEEWEALVQEFSEEGTETGADSGKSSGDVAAAKHRIRTGAVSPRLMRIGFLYSDDADEELKEMFTKKTKQINKVLLSSGGHFLIWYATEGTDAITDSHAETLADTLEKTIGNYEELTGEKYSFTPGSLGSYATNLAKQKALAKTFGIDPAYCTKAMHVYVCTYNDNRNNLATYHSYGDDPKYKALFENLRAIANSVRGVSSFPCITYKPYNETGLNARQVISHELFHHFQSFILPGNSAAYRNGSSDDYGTEATADWASALVTENTGSTDGMLNSHAGNYVKYSHELLGKYEYKLLRTPKEEGSDECYKQCDVGYYLFPLLINYQETVAGGTEKILRAIYAGSFLSSLEANSTKEERMSLMTRLMLRNLNNDYDNYNVRAKKGVTPVFRNLTERNSVKEETLNRAAIRYYRLSGKDGEIRELCIKNADTSVAGALLEKKKDRYILLETGQGTEFRLSNEETDREGEYYLAVYNTSLNKLARYDLSLSILEEETTAAAADAETASTAVTSAAETQVGTTAAAAVAETQAVTAAEAAADTAAAASAPGGTESGFINGYELITVTLTVVDTDEAYADEIESIYDEYVAPLLDGPNDIIEEGERFYVQPDHVGAIFSEPVDGVSEASLWCHRNGFILESLMGKTITVTGILTCTEDRGTPVDGRDDVRLYENYYEYHPYGSYSFTIYELPEEVLSSAVSGRERIELIRKKPFIFMQGLSYSSYDMSSPKTFLSLWESGWKNIQSDSQDVDFGKDLLEPGETVGISLAAPGETDRFGLTAFFVNTGDTPVPYSKAGIRSSCVYLYDPDNPDHTVIDLTDRTVLGEVFDPAERFGEPDSTEKRDGRTIYKYGVTGESSVLFTVESGRVYEIGFRFCQ